MTKNKYSSSDNLDHQLNITKKYEDQTDRNTIQILPQQP